MFGLTGGIAMGKTAVSLALAARGERVVDTDEIARALVEPGQASLEDICGEFGKGILASDGRLNRGALAELVFAEDARRKKLEAILHPRIRAAWRKQVEEWRGNGAERVLVVIPLLFETGAEKELDRTLCVACAKSTQAARLRERGWSDAQARQRIEAQWPIERKMDRADGVIWNESTLEVAAEQAMRLLDG